jgi:hypothetical protein
MFGTNLAERVPRSVRARSPKAPKSRSLPGDLVMKSKQNATFNAQEFLGSGGIAGTIVEYRRTDVIFTQDDPCEHVLYIQ